LDATDFLTDRREILATASLTGPRTAHCEHLGGTHVTDIAGSEDLRGITAIFGTHRYRAGQFSYNSAKFEPMAEDLARRHSKIGTNRVHDGYSRSTENSVRQARWILVPLFGLWIAFAAAGAILW
jgi:hypothetical protein